MADVQIPPTVLALGWSERLSAAQRYVRDCEERWHQAIDDRNRLTVEAIDSGYSGHQAARDMGMKQPSIVRICSSSQPDVAPQG